jgi:hypothetical protein
MRKKAAREGRPLKLQTTEFYAAASATGGMNGSS